MADELGQEEVRLHVLGGPAAGEEFVIDGGECSLGRGRQATISIPDSLLSRTHLRLFREGDGWRIEDLGSTNGTWIRGERQLGVGFLPYRTPVRAGKTLFELYRPGKDEPRSTLDESLIAYRLEPLSVAEVTLAGSGLPSPEVDRERRKLATIYQVQSLLSANVDDQEMHRRILELVTGALAADHAYLLTYDAAANTLEPVTQRDAAGSVSPIRAEFLSQSILSHVTEHNEAIVSRDLTQDERFSGQSLASMQARTLMCVPMMGQRGLRGVIYLVSMQGLQGYNEEDLRLLSAIAHAAGLALENRALAAENLRKERMAAIGLAASGLSHCVKNILTGLEGSVSLMRMGIDSKDMGLINSGWDILAKNHKRLSSLMLDLLNLARDENLEFTTCNLSELLRETADLLRPQFEAEHVALVTDGIDPRQGLYAEVDNRGIHRVLLNLLNNARDAVRERYRDTGGGQIALRLRLDPARESCIIEIEDNGVGIATAELDKVFELFHTTKGLGGTGLGLAVSKRIVELHRGRIGVRSQPGAGTIFSVSLPLKHQA